MGNLPFSAEVFDSINEGIYVLDKEGNYIYCNSSFLKMVGASKEEVLKLNAFELAPGGLVSVSVAVMAFQNKRKQTIVNNVVTPKGYRYRQLAMATPIFDGMGNIQYMLIEMIRLDIFQKRYQKALLTEDKHCIEIGGMAGVMEREDRFIAESAPMKTLLALAEQVAKVDAAVLITGETGTGKEVVAHFIHQHSNRSEHKMVEINCAALPENLLEAELFGYEKGAFTGASNKGKSGLIEEADGGTLFLDEINSLPLILQGKLLRVLESHKSKRLGSIEEKTIDFRLLTATNRDLKQCVAEGTFRADLYYRLNVIPIEIPALRDRKDDIVPLTMYFLDSFCKKYGRTKIVSKECMEQLLRYEWPGNVRELKNVVERMVITTSVGAAEIQQIPGNLWEMPMTGDNDAEQSWIRGQEMSEEALKADSGEMHVKPDADTGKAEHIDFPDNFCLKESVEAYEKHLLEEAIRQFGSSYKVAAALKTDQSTVVRKRKKYGI